jgi:glycosyltransferase involved in cell wall biosynthesis
LKILIITPRIPYPPFRGDKLKIYNLSKKLSINNTVKILTFHRNKNQLKELKHLNELGIEIETIKLSFLHSVVKVILALFTNKPFQVSWFSSGKMKHILDKEINSSHYDVIYFHLIRSAQYLDDLKVFNKSLKIIDLTDAVSLYLKRFSEIIKNPFKKLFIKIEQKRIEIYEKNVEKFNMVYICSDIDKNYLIDKGIKSEIKILNNGIDTAYFNSERINYDKERIIFTGNMPYYANYDAAIYFATELFPLITKQIPESKFFIVGQKPPRKIKSLSSDKIIVTGFVPDIKSEYLKSAVNVAPMRFGAGTLNKVIESIALGVPVVATTMAVNGLPKELKKYVFVADDSIGFVDHVINIIRTPSLRSDLWEEGQLVVRKLLDWKTVVQKFEDDLVLELKKLRVNK